MKTMSSATYTTTQINKKITGSQATHLPLPHFYKILKSYCSHLIISQLNLLNLTVVGEALIIFILADKKEIQIDLPDSRFSLLDLFLIMMVDTFF